MSSYLITGSSRGLGLAMAAQLATFPLSIVSTIFATARSESAALKQLVGTSSGRIVLVKLDATNMESIKNAAAEVEAVLSGKGLDVLVNNAGIMGYTPGGDDLGEHFTTNVLSVHWVTRAFISLLQQGSGKKIANISSSVRSTNLAPSFPFTPTPAYKISKAALNMLTIQYSLTYSDDGFNVFAVSPGWLQTDMGNAIVEAGLKVEEGAKCALEKIMGAGKEDNGRFINILVKGWEKT